jgi:hypothetical protein
VKRFGTGDHSSKVNNGIITSFCFNKYVSAGRQLISFLKIAFVNLGAVAPLWYQVWALISSATVR